MNALVAQRCVYHVDREAAARCPECSRFFCRECISEHDDRVLCARCLATRAAAKPQRRSRVGWALRCFAAVLGLAIAWFFFDLLGRGLVRLPSDVHDGTVWKSSTAELEE